MVVSRFLGLFLLLMILLLTLVFKVSVLLLSIIVSLSSLCSDRGNKRIQKSGSKKSGRKVLSSDDDSDSGRDIKSVNIKKKTITGKQVPCEKTSIFSNFEDKIQFLSLESGKIASTRDGLTDKRLKDTSDKSFNPSENSKNPVSSRRESEEEQKEVSIKKVKGKKEKLRKMKSKSLDSCRREGESLKGSIKTSDKELAVPKSPVSVKDDLKEKTVINMKEIESSKRDKNEELCMKKSEYVMDAKFIEEGSVKENKSMRDKPTDGSVIKNLHSHCVDGMQMKTKSINSGRTICGFSMVHPKNINRENSCSEKSSNRERKDKKSSKPGLSGTSPDVKVNSKKRISSKGPKSKKEIDNRVRSTEDTSKNVVADISISSIRDQDKKKVDKSKVSLNKQSVRDSELSGKEQKQKSREDKREIKPKYSGEKKSKRSSKGGSHEASKNISKKSEKEKTFKLNNNSIGEKGKVKPKQSSKKENLESSLKGKVDLSKKEVSNNNNDKKLLNNSKKQAPGDSRKTGRSSRKSSSHKAPEAKIIDDIDFAKNMGKAMELFNKRNKEKKRSKPKKDEDEDPQPIQSTSNASDKKRTRVGKSLKKISKKMFSKKQ